MRWRRRVETALAVLVIAGLVALAFGVPSPRAQVHAGGTRVRLAYFPNLTHAPALIGVADGRFQRELGDTRLETTVVSAGPEAMEALLAGVIDAAYVGPSPAINTYVKSRGEALRIVAGVCEGGAMLMARNGVPIRSLKDLDGRRVAVPQTGGTQDVALRKFLSGVGLAPVERRGTVDIKPIKNPDVLALFKKGELDAAWVPEPWAARLRAEAGAQTVLDERDLWPAGRFVTTVLVVSRRFEREQPEAVAALVRANGETIAWMNANPMGARAAANEQLEALTGKALARPVVKDAWSHLSFSSDVHRPSIEEMARAAEDAGYLDLTQDALAGLFEGRGDVARR